MGRWQRVKLSDRGAQLIMEFEGFRSCPYRDAVGKWTIGFGSTKGVGPKTPCITREQAEARMRREIDATYGKAVNDLPVDLTQNQHDALVVVRLQPRPRCDQPEDRDRPGVTREEVGAGVERNAALGQGRRALVVRVDEAPAGGARPVPQRPTATETETSIEVKGEEASGETQATLQAFQRVRVRLP